VVELADLSVVELVETTLELLFHRLGSPPQTVGQQ
jgi:hypothetical protein